MKVDQIIDVLNNHFPQYLQESFDNTGSQIIFNESEIDKILLSLDIDMTVINEAIDKKCSLIIAHHPFFFKHDSVCEHPVTICLFAAHE